MIKFIEGDLFDFLPYNPEEGTALIAHVCNNINGWGAGFVVPLGKHFPDARRDYVDKGLESTGHVLGQTEFVYSEVDPRIIIANMIAQEGIGIKKVGDEYLPPIRYEALLKCMEEVRDLINEIKQKGSDRYFGNKKIEVFCPMFGCGLAGGDPAIIVAMMEAIWTLADINVNVFFFKKDFPSLVATHESPYPYTPDFG